MDNNFAPPIESYLPTPTFKYSPRQREIDFAQLHAAGALPVEAIIKSGIVPREEANKLTRKQLYNKAATLLRSEAIQERVDHFRTLHRASMDVSATRIKQELAAIAFVDPALAMEDRTHIDPTTQEETTIPSMVRDIRTLPRHLRAAIKEFYIDRDGYPRYKFHDKLKSIQMIADLEGLFNDAHAAKAPTISFNLGGTSTPLDQDNIIDITPSPAPQPLPEFLK